MDEFTRSTLPSPQSYQDREVIVIEPDQKRTRLFSDGLSWYATVKVDGSADPGVTAAQLAALQALVAGGGNVIYAGIEYTGWGQSSDATNLQAIIDAAPVGATVVLPRSCYLTSQVTSDKSLVGQGMGHYRYARPTDAQTIINVDSQTLTPIKLIGTGIHAEHFHVYNAAASTPTAGSAVVWEGVPDGEGCSSVKVHRVSSFGFFDGTLTLTGDTSTYEVSFCIAQHFVRFGYFVNPTAYAGDNADGEFRNNHSIANGNRSPLAGFGWFGGGGCRIINHKTNSEPTYAPWSNTGRCKYGVLLAPKAGVNTTLLQLLGGSHENLQSGGIQVCVDVNPSETLLGSQVFGGVVGAVEITGGAGGIYAGGSSSYGVRVKGASGNRIESVSIIGVKWLGGSSGVDASQVDDLTVIGNSHKDVGSDFPTHINTDGTVARIRTDYGTGDGPRTLWLSGGNGGAGSSLSDGNNTPFAMSWELDNLNSLTTFFSAVLSPLTDVVFTYIFGGLAQGSGAAYYEEKYAVYWAGSGNTPVYTLISSLYRNAGSAVTQANALVDITLVGNTAGTLDIKVNKKNAATALCGKLTLRVDGVLKKAQRMLT